MHNTAQDSRGKHRWLSPCVCMWGGDCSQGGSVAPPGAAPVLAFVAHPPVLAIMAHPSVLAFMACFLPAHMPGSQSHLTTCLTPACPVLTHAHPTCPPIIHHASLPSHPPGSAGHVRQPASLPSYQPACQPASLPASLPACQPACLPACQPAHLPACLSACLPTRMPAHPAVSGCPVYHLPACLPGLSPGRWAPQGQC